MEEILDIITSLYDELSVYIQDYMLLIASSRRFVPCSSS